MTAHMLAESIVERATVETPRTDAAVRMLEAGWLSLGSSAPGAVKPLIEALEVFERELIDIKQRLLPQANGRAERAENARRMAVVERDALLEELIVRRTAIANLHEEINGMREKFNAAIRDKLAAQTAAVNAEQDAIAAEDKLAALLEQLIASKSHLAAAEAQLQDAWRQVAEAMDAPRSATVAPKDDLVQQLNGALMNSMGKDFEISAAFVRDELIPALKAAQVESATAAPDMVLVPREITQSMKDALNSYAICAGYIEEGYRAMLSAAPATPQSAPVEEGAISRDLWLFLKGESTLDGFWFGEHPIGKPHYWWRSYMKQQPTGCDDAGER
jgi:hypothetical protein